LAAGVAVIQTTNGWMKDFVSQHEVGFTVDPNNANALAELLIEIEANPQAQIEMGKRAMEIAKLEFDITILSKKMLSSIKDVCKN
jgi:glycosyltransferase involved in cell wall biosynthesis